MTTITDLQSLKLQNAALQAAIAQAIAPFGLTLDRQAGSIDPSNGKLKLTLTTSFLPAGVEDKETLERATWETLERATWAKYAPMFDLPADAYGKTIMLGGKPFTLVAMNLQRTKNNVSVRRVEDGKVYLTTHDTVKRLLSKTA